MDEKKPLIEFERAYSSKYFDVVVDTVTDVCYIMTKNDAGIPSVQIMLTPEGKPRTLHYVEKEIKELEQVIQKLEIEERINKVFPNPPECDKY